MIKKDLSCPELHIGCFHSLGVLSNHKTQAQAALIMAEELDKPLVFHVIQDRFSDLIILNELNMLLGRKHTLASHSSIDEEIPVTLGMFSSLTALPSLPLEVTVRSGVPCIGTFVKWLPGIFRPDPNDIEDMVSRGITALWLNKWKIAEKWQRRRLNVHTSKI